MSILSSSKIPTRGTDISILLFWLRVWLTAFWAVILISTTKWTFCFFLLYIGLHLYRRDAAFPELGHNSRHSNGKCWEPILIDWVTGNSCNKLYQIAAVRLDVWVDLVGHSLGGAHNYLLTSIHTLFMENKPKMTLFSGVCLGTLKNVTKMVTLREHFAPNMKIQSSFSPPKPM